MMKVCPTYAAIELCHTEVNMKREVWKEREKEKKKYHCFCIAIH